MTNLSAKTIKIFLTDGDPTSIKIVELSNRTIIAYMIPRNKLEVALNDNENKRHLHSQCVYFLTGELEDGKQSVYVGEAEEFSTRIRQHQNNNNKDFWSLVIAFTSKDDNLTKAHIKYLESKITQAIKENNTVLLGNKNIPPMPKLPRSDIAEMEEFYEQIKVLSSTLGYTFLEDIDTSNNVENIFYCKGTYCDARSIITNEGYLLLEGSLLRKLLTHSTSKQTIQRRDIEKEKGNIKEYNGNQYKVIRKIKFTSPSAIASFSLGRSANGWSEWKNNNGVTLNKLRRDRE